MKKHVPISVLKSLSKALFKILKDKDLEEIDLKQSKDILTALEVAVPLRKRSRSPLGLNPIIVDCNKNSQGLLPLAYTSPSFWQASNTWGLTDQGLREQVLIYGSMGSGACSEWLVSLSQDLIRSGKGLVYLDGSGDMTLYARMFGFCYENKILERLKFVQSSVSDKDSRDPESHSLNILSGMNQEKLCAWMGLVMRTWEETNPELFEKIPENHSNILPLMAKNAIKSCQENNFLTLNILNDYFEKMSVKDNTKDSEVKKEDDTGCPKTTLTVPERFIEQQELEKSLASVSLLWRHFLSPFVRGMSSLGTDYADVHLLPAIKNKDIVVVSKPYYYTKAFTNMIGASISMASDCVNDEEDIQDVLIVSEYFSCLSPFLVKSLSDLRFSNIGAIWHTNTEKNKDEVFYINPSTVVVMQWQDDGLHGIAEKHQHKLLKNGIISTKDLRPGQCYLISENPPMVEVGVDGAGRFKNPSVVEMSTVYAACRSRSSPFIVKQKKYETLEEIKKALNSKKSEQELTEQAYKLFCACLNNKKSGISLSWCQNTVSKIMGYSNWHHACAEISAKNKK